MNTEQIQPAIQLRHEFSIAVGDATVATATVERNNGVYWLSNVYTHHEHRRKHFASRLLTAVIETFGHTDLYLHTFPYYDRPISAETLTAWYSRFGFEPTDVPGILHRSRGAV